MWQLWFLIAIIFAIAQFYYKGSFLLWFIIGALITLISSLFLHHLLLESIIFLIISFILFLTLTPYLTSKFTSSKALTTNTDKLIGRHGIVIKPIGQTHLESGLIRLDGEIWSAVSISNDIISVGSFVEVYSVKGVRLIVTPVKNNTHKFQQKKMP